MSNINKRGLAGLQSFKAKNIDINADQIEISPANVQHEYPVIIDAKNRSVILVDWLKKNNTLVQSMLDKSGAIVFRNFDVLVGGNFRDVVKSYGKETMEYDLGAAKRIKFEDNIYISTLHPAQENLEMHNEMSYAMDYPMQILLYCDIAAESGGETPVCDGRILWKMLKEETKSKFLDLGVMYVRQLGPAFGGLTWQMVFQTNEREIAEKKCQENDMEYEWLENDVLKLKWTKPATCIHPNTNEIAWFNHAFFFNSFMLRPGISDTLKPADMPFYTFYGDGSEIEMETIKELSVAFEKTKSCFTWKSGDLFLVDNILMSHGRNAFEGDRKVLVAMFKSVNI
jgi:alpha-ketoglutarate-dependent taurine dioxygenase